MHMGSLLRFGADSRDYDSGPLVNVLTRGGGSCLFYALDEIHCEALAAIMNTSLRRNLQEFLEIDCVQKNKDEKILKLQQIVDKYKFNISGIGLTLEDAEQVIEATGLPTIMYILPLKEKTLLKQAE